MSRPNTGDSLGYSRNQLVLQDTPATRYFAGGDLIQFVEEAERYERSYTPVDTRTEVCARSVEEALSILRLSQHCTELDFTYNVNLSGPDVYRLERIVHDAADPSQQQRFAAASRQLRAVSEQIAVKEVDESPQEAAVKLHELQEPAIRVFQAFSDNQVLETLRLDGKYLGEEAISVLAEALQINRTLLFLDLSSNFVTGASPHLLGKAVNSHCLRELYLDFCGLGNQGTEDLAVQLQGNVCLQTLSLRGNDIGPDFPQSVLWLTTPKPQTSGRLAKELQGQNLFDSTLTLIRMDDNQLQDLPIRLGSVGNLTMTIERNPLEHPSPNITKKGWRAIWTVLREEFLEYEAWQAEQMRLHALALKQNSTLPKFVPPQDYEGTNVEDM